MPASIRVESGISAGTSYWVDRPVLRIGSDPQCEICLPSAELAAHAMTLEYRAGEYRAYNRGSDAIRIGRTLLPAGAHGTWEAGDPALLPGDLRLVLDIDGDPQPCPRPESRAGDTDIVDAAGGKIDAATIAPGGAAAKSSSRTLGQLGVIGVCVAMMAVFLTMGTGEKAAAPPTASFESIVKKLLAEGESSELLLRRLQYAEAALVRGRRNTARARFLSLRDRLRQQAEAGEAKDGDSRELVRKYAEYRVGQLQ